jgi:hypothetical protein
MLSKIIPSDEATPVSIRVISLPKMMNTYTKRSKIFPAGLFQILIFK